MQQDVKDRILKAREFKTRADVLAWFRELLDAGVNFHPEDSGVGLVDIETSEPTFSAAEAGLYDALMKQATIACEFAYKDVCALACEAFDQFMADNSLAVAMTNEVAQNMKANFLDIERAVSNHSPAVVLQTLANSLRVASDESRSNGPNALTEDEQRQHDAAQAIEDLISDYF